MRVLVSGGTGLVGRYIVEELLASGYSVTVGGRTCPPARFFSQTVGFVPLRLDPDHDHSHAFSGMDAYVHAAFDHVSGKYRGGEGDDPQAFRRRNLDGTLSMFAAARKTGVRRCVFLSSRAVYDGLPDGTKLREDAVLAPTTLYGEIKLETERALAEMTDEGFLGASLRLTGVYGHLRPNKWDALISDYLAGRPVPSRAGTEVHGRDVGKAVGLLLVRHPQSIAGRSFNVSDVVTDNREILSIVQSETASTHPLPEAADRSSVAVMDTSGILSLGWGPGGRPLLEKTVRLLVRSALRKELKTSRVVRPTQGTSFLRLGRLRRPRR
ncbi:NAD(P)-dependent oxidoreductase [Rhizobium sp. RU36D]|uniref:NAD-dependent epimerase/dehydratase family protein n=1 Tax=Rhizobium sp. RU36D TaxID=1907415 RepID=UPI0009D80583|nr:NAD(P)-dependent oxidoreductase [Rhizobium sp. RU36D]SMC41340.1 Nucleoside-diphosphate-sugar epimerase [Rhizobium sp. RU36D]